MRIKPIKNFESYSIREDGAIFNKQGKKLKQQINNVGYSEIHLYKNKKYHVFLVHRLVLMHFKRFPEKTEQANHKDGKKANNCVNNLEWVTAKQNRNHAIRVGLIPIQKGEGNYNNILTNKNVIEIKKSLKMGECYKNIARKYGVHKSTIGRIARNEGWTHINV